MYGRLKESGVARATVLRIVAAGAVVASAIWLTCVCEDSIKATVSGTIGKGQVSVSEDYVNFGKVFGGQTLRHEFVMENRGRTAVTVGKIRGTCRCMAALLKGEKVLESGGKAVVAVEWNTADMQGDSKEIVYVLTSADSEDLIRLRLQANVVRAFDVVPATLYFRDVEFGKPSTRQIEISTIQEGRAEDVGDLACDKSWIVGKLAEGRSDARGGRKYLLTAAVLPGAPVGEFRTSLAVDLKVLDKRVRATIPVQGSVVENVKATPPSVFFGVVRKGTRVSRRLVLEGRFRPFEIKEVNCANGWITARVVVRRKGSSELMVTVDASEEGPIDAVIALTTDDADCRTARIPVAGLVESDSSQTDTGTTRDPASSNDLLPGSTRTGQ